MAKYWVSLDIDVEGKASTRQMPFMGDVTMA
jgi:hypothetical protein